MNREQLIKIPIDSYKEIFNAYAEGLPDKYNLSKTYWEDVLNVIVIRCNDIYVTNNELRNNDWLVCIYNNLRYVYKCTADPKYKRDRIANLREQVYYGNIRPHRWIGWRTCIAQDNCKVWVRRYANGKWYEELGHFGINIHNSAGYFNSSLGCVILADESRYINSFRPLLRTVKKQTNRIPVAVINIKWFEQQAEAILGINIKSDTSPKKAII